MGVIDTASTLSANLELSNVERFNDNMPQEGNYHVAFLIIQSGHPQAIYCRLRCHRPPLRSRFEVEIPRNEEQQDVELLEQAEPCIASSLEDTDLEDQCHRRLDNVRLRKEPGKIRPAVGCRTQAKLAQTCSHPLKFLRLVGVFSLSIRSRATCVVQSMNRDIFSNGPSALFDFRFHPTSLFFSVQTS